MWNNVKPSKPGWYWCLNEGDDPNIPWCGIVRVERLDDGLLATWLAAPGRPASLRESEWSEDAAWSEEIIPPLPGGSVPTACEAQAASRWWADQLRTRSMTTVEDYQRLNGDNATADVEMAEIVSQVVKLHTPTERQIQTFEIVLAQLIQASFITHDSWATASSRNDPQYGSALRCIGVDYGPDAILSAAYQASGGVCGVGLFPLKTSMWVNPGEVRVRLGYRGQEMVIDCGGE